MYNLGIALGITLWFDVHVEHLASLAISYFLISEVLSMNLHNLLLLRTMKA